jgi:hypothetical protein
MKNIKIAYCKIFPSIGIARVGDSTNPNENGGWFIAPEFENEERPEGFSFRDADGKIKKQGAKFRIYAFDSDDNPIGEITNHEAEITWKVELANKKASWFFFDGTEKALNVFMGNEDGDKLPRGFRNPHIGKMEFDKKSKKHFPNDERKKMLEIHGSNILIVQNVKEEPIIEGYKISGKFKEVISVELGELKTDSKGRLIVLGGNGHSDAIDENGNSIKERRWIRNYANNSDWFDDVSDGPVTATVKIKNTEESIEVRDGAWVVVAPPDFAPDVKNIVTLYDVMEEVAWRNESLINKSTPNIKLPENVNFDLDIKPVLKSMHSQRWVNGRALKGHGTGKTGDFQDRDSEKVKKGGIDPDILIKELSPKSADEDSPKGRMIREKIVDHLRQPAYSFFVNGKFKENKYGESQIINQAKSMFMPPLSGDEGDIVDNDPSTWLSLTYLQYERFCNWKKNPYARNEVIEEVNPIKMETDCLTKTVLSNCAGGAFFPGIEMTCISRVPSLYKEAFRINHQLSEAGDMTKYMALPWQADFWECQQHWWPAQRPDDVITDEDFNEIFNKFTQDVGNNYEMVLFNRKRWDRGLTSKERPSPEYLLNRLLPIPTFKKLKDEVLNEEEKKALINKIKIDDYIDLISGITFEYSDDHTFINWFDFDGLGGDFSENKYRKRGVFTRLIASIDTANLPSPWRLQYLFQELMDNYSGLYFSFVLPSPETAFARSAREDKKAKSFFEIPFKSVKVGEKSLLSEGIKSYYDFRQEWSYIKSKNNELAKAIIDEYIEQVNSMLTSSIHNTLTKFKLAYEEKLNKQLKKEGKSGKSILLLDFIEGLSQSVSTIEEQEYLYSDFTENNPKYHIIRAVQMIEMASDYLYSVSSSFAGDMGMVNGWNNLGFVTSRKVKWIGFDQKPKENMIQYEQDRTKYDGLTFRDYFYILMNLQEFPDFHPYAKKIAQNILTQAQGVIDEIGIDDSDHPEAFVPYSREAFNAKMEEIYEILKKQAAGALGWRDSRNREARVRRIYDSAVFNQTDGSWLRYISNTGKSDKINALLFEVWSDEIGNGNPYLHHGNLYTNLLQSLGIYLAPLNSRNYADNPEIHESRFIGAVFQLAISLHTEEFYSELIGMTLFLEWEVLSLVSGIKGLDYLGIDSHFWQMHVGIDNATHGHGAKAKEAVELYLDKVLKESGTDAMQEEWKRIWRGFVAFAVASGNAGYFGDDLDQSRKHPGNPQSEIIDLIKRKAHYGGLNHSGKNLGGHRLNDLFDEPEIFVEELANSSYVVPGKPEQSKLLNHLTTYEGPMYKVFDEKDLKLWEKWILWLGKEGETEKNKAYQSKAKSMYLLLHELKEVARGIDGHKSHGIVKIENVNGNDKFKVNKIATYFENGSIDELMNEFKSNLNNGWVTPYYPDKSPLITELAKGNRPMGAILDKRFPNIGNQIGRLIILKWIEAGCPLVGKEDEMIEKEPPTECWNGKVLLVQQKGMGAVH